MPMRKSHENPAVKKLYEEFLGEPLSHKSHELLHTHYTAAGEEGRNGQGKVRGQGRIASWSRGGDEPAPRPSGSLYLTK